MSEFAQHDLILHVKNQDVYEIVTTPVLNQRLEYINEPFYAYRSFGSGIVWYRCKSEMEDGRFVRVPQDEKDNYRQLFNITEED